MYQRTCRVSGSGTIAPTYNNDDVCAPLADQHGRLIVVVSSGGGGGNDLFYDSAALESAAAVTNTTHVLRSVNGHTKTNGRWVMVFDLAAPPGPGAVPMYSVAVPFAEATFDLDLTALNGGGRRFVNGIQIALSTSDATLTLDAIANAWFNVVYNV